VGEGYDEVVSTIKISDTYVMYGGDSFNVSTDSGSTFTKYLAPTGWLIGGIEKANGYYYVFCYKPGNNTHKIFRVAI